MSVSVPLQATLQPSDGRHCQRVNVGFLAIVLAFIPCLTAQEVKQPMTFEAASVKLAPPGAMPTQSGLMMPSNQAPLPRGLMRMTSRVSVYLFFAEGLDDFTEFVRLDEGLPSWTKRQLYTISARINGEPTREQLQQMMHALFVERFALKVHEEIHDGPVVRLIQDKGGIPGPGLKPHSTTEACDADALRRSQPPEGSKPPVCGMSMYTTDDGLLHIGLVNVTLSEAAKMLGGIAGQMGGRSSVKMLDGTGLSGKWDVNLSFKPDYGIQSQDDDGGLTFTGAIQKQLGLKLQTGVGPVRTLVVDHISPPTLD